jgi:hypothetical protein
VTAAIRSLVAAPLAPARFPLQIGHDRIYEPYGPRYTAADRALLAAVSRLLPTERWSCFAVTPQTLRRWHRALLQGNRRRRGRRPGRPPLAAETRGLILRLARENTRWGYMRIQGELLKLGINVSATTVATMLRVSGLGRRRGGSAPAGPSSCAHKRRACSAPVSPPSEVAASRATCPRGAPELRKAHPAKRKPTRSSPRMLRCRGPPGCRCQVCRRCRESPRCLIPATRWPRRGGLRSNGMRAMDQGHAGAPCMRERVDRAVKAGACARAASKPQPQVGFPGPLPDPSPSPRRTTGRPTAPP